MVSVKFWRGNFRGRRPRTSALHMLLRLSAVKSRCGEKERGLWGREWFLSRYVGKITHALPDVPDLRTSGNCCYRALRFVDHMTKRNGGSGDENNQTVESAQHAQSGLA